MASANSVLNFRGKRLNVDGSEQNESNSNLQPTPASGANKKGHVTLQSLAHHPKHSTLPDEDLIIGHEEHIVFTPAELSTFSENGNRIQAPMVGQGDFGNLGQVTECGDASSTANRKPRKKKVSPLLMLLGSCIVLLCVLGK